MQFHPILTSIALAGCLVLMPLAPSHAQPGATARTATDELIVEMSQAFKKSNSKRLSSLLPQVAGHPLEPWAAYWELRARLDTAAPSEVQQFFSRFAGTYQEDRLRNDWLLLLGQRRYWTDFAAEQTLFRMSDDREVRCYTLALEPLQSNAERVNEFKRQWYGQKEMDDGCAYGAAQMYAAKLLSEADVWHKARLAMEANRPKAAKAAAAMISSAAAAPIDEISNNATRYLAKRVVAVRRVSREAVVLALIRMAASDPDGTASVLENHWSVHLNAEQRSWAWGVIGRQAAQRLSAHASEYFAKASDADLDDEHLGWKVRAALRQGQWRAVAPAIEVMSAEARREAVWVYWKARALLQLARSDADRAAAKEMLAGIAGVRGFYEQLALEELGQRVSAPARPEPLTAQEKDSARLHAGLNRALYAIQIGLRSDGIREWNYSANLHQRGGMSERELLAAADLACQHEVWDRCI
ncbi:MAG: lytic transglycosylase domain-containing protein, partial [Comamonadaceae bacterium]